MICFSSSRFLRSIIFIFKIYKDLFILLVLIFVLTQYSQKMYSVWFKSSKICKTWFRSQNRSTLANVWGEFGEKNVFYSVSRYILRMAFSSGLLIVFGSTIIFTFFVSLFYQILRKHVKISHFSWIRLFLFNCVKFCFCTWMQYYWYDIYFELLQPPRQLKFIIMILWASFFVLKSTWSHVQMATLVSLIVICMLYLFPFFT